MPARSPTWRPLPATELGLSDAEVRTLRRAGWCTSSAGSGSPTRSGTSRARSAPVNGNGFACIPTSPSGCFSSPRRWRRSGQSPSSTASGWTALAIRAGCPAAAISRPGADPRGGRRLSGDARAATLPRQPAHREDAAARAARGRQGRALRRRRRRGGARRRRPPRPPAPRRSRPGSPSARSRCCGCSPAASPTSRSPSSS